MASKLNLKRSNPVAKNLGVNKSVVHRDHTKNHRPTNKKLIRLENRYV